MGKKPPLKLVKPSSVTGSQPSRTLGKAGATLWSEVMTEYDLQDSGGLEMLLQACAALDRAENLRLEIDRDGEVIRTRGTVRTLSRLGLNFETVKPVGRPPQPIGWQPP